ncbi:MAG: c-type cytochrome, partial [Nitrospinae bacterium]|nr:c-type cytochrome [Nitrospinota bacterium]
YAKEGKSKAHMDRGELLFRNKKSCFACHRLGDEGGRVGPDLSRAALNYNPEWIYAWARNPQVFKPRSKMPNQGLSSREAGAIAAFLASYEPEMEEEDDEDEASEEKPPFPEEWKKYLDMRGDTKRGQNIFEDPEGKSWCSKCHRVKGEGGMVGPDLSFVGTSRTKSFLMESILNPKAVITTGFSSVMILTHDRKFITGIQKNEDDLALYIVDKEGRDQVILKERIKKFKKQKISMMPGNFKDLLTVQEVADLLAYLGALTVPEMADAK